MESSRIREQVETIQRSQSFASKGQLRKLLEVLLKNSETQSQLSPELIIKELWPDEIRTKRSTDVATEMNRLRHALDAYYEREGKGDPARIVLPNRAAAAANGTQEKRWIAIEPREADRIRGTSLLPMEWVRGAGRGKKTTVIVVLCAIPAFLVFLSIRALVVHEQPRFARLEGSTLVVTGSDGKELWRKFFADGFEPNEYYSRGIASRVWFGDLEGTGHTSVLFLYTPGGPMAHSSTLICYSDRGKERWRWTPGRELPELQGSAPTFHTKALQVLKATENKPRRIVVASTQDPWWPSQIAIIDSKGQTLSEYWHSGGLDYIVLGDVDGDGKEEIIAAGVANGYDHQATLVILDPDRVFGASTEVRPDFQIHGMGTAQERFRLLFPRSDLNRALYQMNAAIEPTIDEGRLRLAVVECRTTTLTCRIVYEFDRSFHLIAGYAGGDEFRSAHEQFYQTGKNAHHLNAAEEAEFLKVRCLVGCQSEYVPVGHQVP